MSTQLKLGQYGRGKEKAAPSIPRQRPPSSNRSYRHLIIDHDTGVESPKADWVNQQDLLKRYSSPIEVRKPLLTIVRETVNPRESGPGEPMSKPRHPRIKDISVQDRVDQFLGEFFEDRRVSAELMFMQEIKARKESCQSNSTCQKSSCSDSTCRDPSVQENLGKKRTDAFGGGTRYQALLNGSDAGIIPHNKNKTTIMKENVSPKAKVSKAVVNRNGEKEYEVGYYSGGRWFQSSNPQKSTHTMQQASRQGNTQGQSYCRGKLQKDTPKDNTLVRQESNDPASYWTRRYRELTDEDVDWEGDQGKRLTRQPSSHQEMGFTRYRQPSSHYEVVITKRKQPTTQQSKLVENNRPPLSSTVNSAISAMGGGSPSFTMRRGSTMSARFESNSSFKGWKNYPSPQNSGHCSKPIPQERGYYSGEHHYTPMNKVAMLNNAMSYAR